MYKKNLFIGIAVLAIAAIATWFISCKNRQIIHDEAVVIQCLNCSKELNFSSENNNLFKKVEYIQLETTDMCLLKEIDYIEIVDTCIFVVDNKQVYKFSKNNGKFLSKIGSIGQGPGEYVAVMSLFVDKSKKEIIVLDLSQSKMIRYDFSGNYISSNKIGINIGLTNTAFYMENGDILFNNHISPYSKSAYSVSNVNADSVKSLLSYEKFDLKGYGFAFSNHPMTYSAEGINCIMPFDNVIYCVKDAHIEAKYSVEYSGKPTDMSMATQEKPSPLLNRLLMAMDNHFPGFTAIFETSGKLILNTFDNMAKPAFFYADIDSLKGKYYAYSSTLDEINPIFEISDVSENMFIAKLNASRLSEWKEQHKDMNEIKNQQLRTIIENTDIENNPCIVIYYVQ